MLGSGVDDGSRQRLTHEEMTDLTPFAGTLVLELVSAAPERVVDLLAHSPERFTAEGVLHGDALMAMADTFGGVCAYLNPPHGSATSTIESKTNLFRAVHGGRVEGVSRPLHVGRSTIVVQTDLSDGEGRRVGQSTQSQAVVRGAQR